METTIAQTPVQSTQLLPLGTIRLGGWKQEDFDVILRQANPKLQKNISDYGRLDYATLVVSTNPSLFSVVCNIRGAVKGDLRYLRWKTIAATTKKVMVAIEVFPGRVGRSSQQAFNENVPVTSEIKLVNLQLEDGVFQQIYF